MMHLQLRNLRNSSVMFYVFLYIEYYKIILYSSIKIFLDFISILHKNNQFYLVKY